MDARRPSRSRALTHTAPEFCDTNVLVYAYGQPGDPKRERAAGLVQRLWESGNGVISIQVLQELYVTLTRKVVPPLPHGDARTVVSRLLLWHVVEPDKADIVAAIDRSVRWRISFWDAMLLTAAHRSGATLLWSEDLAHGQTYDGVTVRNPFKEGVTPSQSP